jgi:predicted permease
MPEWQSEIRRRLAGVPLRPTREIEIVEEIAQHLEERFTRARAAGASEAEAEARAWRELDEDGVLGRAIGGVESPAPLSLPAPGAASRAGWIGTVWQDARYSLRALRAAPVFTSAVLLAIALSIGPVTAIVSIGNWLLWRPHPGVTDSGSLALVWFGEWRGNGMSPAGVSNQNLADLAAAARTFTAIAGVQESDASLAVPGAAPMQAKTSLVSANFFEALGVRLAAGRSFTPDEDRGPFGSPVVVISHRLAQSAFGLPDRALGKTIALNSRPFTIVGVANAAFGGISNEGEVDAWVTGATWPHLHHVEQPRTPSRADGIFYAFVVRAAPATSFEQVDAELKVLARQLAATHPKENAKFLTAAPRLFPGLGLMPLMRASTRGMVGTLLTIGGVLLLLGCANVANLLIFRGAKRAQEIAVRKALGASGVRLLQLQMMESWLLSCAGAVVGLALAFYLKQLIEQLLFPKPSGMSFEVPIDLRVLAATAAVALTAGTLAALAPAWLLARARGLAALGRGTVTWSRAPKLRGGLAVLQLALSLTLLIGALLLVATLRNLRSTDLGFDPEGVTTVYVDLSAHGYDQARAVAYHREVLPALQGNAGFESVSLAERAPFGPSSSLRLLPSDGGAQTVSVRGNGVGAAYFRVLSIPIIRGRAFTDDEAMGSSASRPAIVNETLARQLFGTVDAVGRTVRLARTGLVPEQDLAVVGVAGDSRWRSIAGPQDPFLYQPAAQFRSRTTSGVYLIKSRLPSSRVGAIANEIAARTAGAVPLYMARPLSTAIDRELSQQRLFAWMLSLLAALGFVLAALGLYGLIAQMTIERRREFGIRLALGAAGRDIVRLVARYAALVASIGVVIGLALSYLGTQLIRSMLFGVSALDPGIYAAAVVTLVVVVVAACAGPAWRAVRVQAMDVLRAE